MALFPATNESVAGTLVTTSTAWLVYESTRLNAVGIAAFNFSNSGGSPATMSGATLVDWRIVTSSTDVIALAARVHSSGTSGTVVCYDKSISTSKVTISLYPVFMLDS